MWLRVKPQYSKRQVAFLLALIAEHHGMKKKPLRDLVGHVDPAAAELIP